jgi:hypothetical protein
LVWILERAAAVHGANFSFGVKLESEFGKICLIREPDFTSTLKAAALKQPIFKIGKKGSQTLV